MNVNQVRARVSEIASVVHDPEAAHGLQDDLYRDVLKAIAHGPEGNEILAEEALRCEDIEFARWYA